MTERFDQEPDQETPIPVPTDEDDIRQYLREIRSYPRLTPEEERELAQRCAQGDEEAIRKMVNCNLRLVVSVAKEYTGRGVPLLDLIQEGSIGLLAAARKFDYTRDLRFSTYATKWIRQGVTRCLLNHGGTIRVPVHTAERMRKIQAARAYLRQQNGLEPTAQEIARRVDLPAEKVEELLQLSPDICSLDVLGSLTPRQQTILRLHFGMEDGTCYSLEAIGEKLGISKERVRQVEKQAMDKLQAMGTSMGLEDFLE